MKAWIIAMLLVLMAAPALAANIGPEYNLSVGFGQNAVTSNGANTHQASFENQGNHLVKIWGPVYYNSLNPAPTNQINITVSQIGGEGKVFSDWTADCQGQDCTFFKDIQKPAGIDHRIENGTEWRVSVINPDYQSAYICTSGNCDYTTSNQVYPAARMIYTFKITNPPNITAISIPNEPKAGEAIPVSAQYTQPDGVNGTVTIELGINGSYDVTQTISVDDLESFNLTYPSNTTNAGDIFDVKITAFDGLDYDTVEQSTTVLCSENWVCSGYASPTCLANDTSTASCNNVTDLNSCGNTYTGDYSEFANQTGSCDYCTPSWSCDGYATCIRPSETANCNSAVDANSCYSTTNVTSDQYSGDYTEFNATECTYSGGGGGAFPEENNNQATTLAVASVQSDYQITSFWTDLNQLRNNFSIEELKQYMNKHWPSWLGIIILLLAAYATRTVRKNTNRRTRR